MAGAMPRGRPRGEAGADFAADFLRHHIGPEELRHIRQLIEAAVRHGDLQTLIYSFPSALCLDEGRAINARADWPDTLQGKARGSTTRSSAMPARSAIACMPRSSISRRHSGRCRLLPVRAPSSPLGLDGVEKPD